MEYNRLFGTMSQGVIYYDVSGNIISANPAAERILGLPLDQMQGQTFVHSDRKLIRKDGSEFPDDEHPFRVVLRTGKRVDHFILGIVVNPLVKALSWLSVTLIPLFHPGESLPHQVYTIFDDITERINAEKERDKLLLELKEALSEVKALRGILSICSYCHRIRNDKGEWEQMERYITDRSEVVFSHGTCPECLAKQLSGLSPEK